MSKILVVIVNFRAATLVCNAIDTVIKQLNLNNKNSKVLIVDNNSQDHSIEIINNHLKKLPEGIVELIANRWNGGFSYGNNLAIKHYLESEGHLPEFVYLLNPDAALKEDALTMLIEFMNENPRAGIVGSRLEGEDGSLRNSAFRFPSLWSELDSGLALGIVSRLLSTKSVSFSAPNAPTRVDWVAGASMLIRQRVIEDIGLMDESYFLYFEETDFCLQAAKKGWECWYVPKSRVVHIEGQSTGVVSGDQLRRRRPKYWFESRQHFYIKNFGYAYTILCDSVRGISHILYCLRRFIQRKPNELPRHFLKDFWANSIFFSWLSRNKICSGS